MIPLMLLAAACQNASSSVQEIGESAPGARASMTFEQLSVAGGQSRLTSVVYDSAALTFDELTCPTGGNLTNCTPVQRRSGVTGNDYLQDAFRLAMSRDARGLKERYDFPGVRPPDVLQHTLTVVANQRRYRVTWDVRGGAPPILSRIVCRLDLARGLLIVCSS